MPISRRNNTIFATGNLVFGDMRRFCAALYAAIRDKQYSDVILDFSRCHTVYQSVMLPLTAQIVHYRTTGVDFSLIAPYSDQLDRLFHHTNWAHYIQPSQYPLNTRVDRHLPAIQFDSEDITHETGILERVMTLLLSHMRVERSTLSAVEWSLGEILDNVITHSQSDVGGFVQATAYQASNEIEFIVADAGIGIPQSMQILDHCVALQRAIGEGVTRDQTIGAGNGLYGSYRVAYFSKGSFSIDSGRGLLYVSPSSDGVQIEKQRIPYAGTSVKCRIGLGDRTLLNRALRFKNTPHEPAYDFVERRFEEGDDVVIPVKKEAERFFGFRSGGAQFRKIVENLLRSRDRIVLDFEGVAVFSSSFADEVFGRLFVDMGPRNFMKRIDFRNADATIEGLVDRAIVQRTKLGNGVPDSE